MWGRGILIEQRPFFPILLLDMQILKENISCVATILLRIVASRGGNVTNSELWWNGPSWLRDPKMWPENPVTVKTEASEEEARVLREVLSLANEKSRQEPKVFEELLKHFDLRRVLRIQAE